jgi:fumarylacetoacetase
MSNPDSSAAVSRMPGDGPAVMLDHTHDPAARSWLPRAARDQGFTLQNLPIGVFRRAGTGQLWHGGIALGDHVVDLAALAARGELTGTARAACEAAAGPALNDYFACGADAWRALRQAVFALAESGATPARQEALRACLVPMAEAEMGLPARVGNYTDFYTSLHHARNVGRAVNLPHDGVTPNFRWLPIAYHGRASSVVVSGTDFHRPMGQMPGPDGTPVFGACARLDYELEMGFFVGPGNAFGQRVPVEEAESHIAGFVLLNDWSARDIQFWEMAPLGPFQGKNFCTSVSPWVVSLDALAPYRLPFERAADEPQPLPYLDGPAVRAAGALDIQLAVHLHTAAMRARGESAAPLSRTSFRHQYWTPAQMLAQHSVGGCNLQSGDLLGTGTVSGPTAGEAGAIIELTKAGREPIVLPDGERRAFLEDGDTVVLSGWCERPGAARIGFGECRGTVLPALG